MKKKDIINLIWKPFFAAVMTGILSIRTDISPVIIGLGLGTAASIALYFDVKSIASKQTDKEN